MRKLKMSIVNQIDSGDRLEDVEHHFRVFAGPGAGKTYWLVGHINNVLQRSKRLNGISRIACISYTNVAAQQIINGLDGNIERVEVSTIHSFLYKYVVKPYLYLLKNDDGNNLVAYDLVDGHDEHRPSYVKLQEWLTLINKRQLLRYRVDFLQALKNLQWKLDEGSDELYLTLRGRVDYFPSSSLDTYKPLFWRSGTIDHEDVLYFSYRILKEFPTIRSFLSALFPYMFLDEFQDTNPIQTEIIKWLSEESTIIGVIGDSKQSIYGFQGAKPEDFEGLELEGQLDYRIANNRRSTNKIIAFLNDIRDDEVKQDPIRTEKGSEIRVIIGDKESVVKYAQEYFGGADTYTTLTRKNIDVSAIRNLRGGNSSNPWDDFHNMDSVRALLLECLVAGAELARQGDFDLALKTVIKGIRIRKGEIYKPFNYNGLFTDISRRGLAVLLIECIINNYDDFLSRKLIEVYGKLSEEISNFKEGLSLSNYRSGNPKIFADQTPYKDLALSVKIGEETRNIRTIHRAKGDEFDNVFVYFDEESEITKIWGNNTERKRIIYVACSRARDRLLLSSPELSPQNKKQLESMELDVVNCDSP
jgi:DNA helicase II / ATP-dependent DNA helicase PcrA